MDWWRLAVALIVVVAAVAARGLCPTRCKCDDYARAATCVSAGLEVVPIQLNPEARLINLTDNAISNVHFTLAFYAKLTVLDISHNKIDTLGTKNFESNSEMINLNASHNKIVRLEKYTFVGLQVLTDMDLSDNSISDIHPLAFHDLRKLERLDLSSNKLVTLEQGTFQQLISLKVLSLTNNGILDIPSDNLANASSLEFLYLSDNLVQSLPKDSFQSLSNLKVIDLNNNIISDVHPSAFDGLPALRHLDLTDNNLTFVPIMSLSKLSNLTHLYLSGNFFRFIPAVSFQSLFHLRHLHISKLHQLERIDPRALVDNMNLERIWMNDNVRVSEIPARLFHGNPKLTHIYMRNNALVTVDASNFPVDQLHELQIAGNPFECNCSMQWLWKLGHEYLMHTSKFSNATDDGILEMDFAEIRCAQPEHLKNILLIEVSESEIRCSMGWMIVASVVLTISVMLILAGGILYFMGPLRCKGDKGKQVMNSVIINGDVPKLSNGLVYNTRSRDVENKRDVDRYLMIGGPIGPSYHQPWPMADKQTYQDEGEDNIYQQFTYETIPAHRTPDKPHIVYV